MSRKPIPADLSKATPAGLDVMDRRVPSEPEATYVQDTRNAERGRGYLSGDGQMHAHRS